MSDESIFQGMLDSFLNFLKCQRLVILDKNEFVKVLLDTLELFVDLTAKVGDVRAVLVQVRLLFDHVEVGESVQGCLDGYLKTSL